MQMATLPENRPHGPRPSPRLIPVRQSRHLRAEICHHAAFSLDYNCSFLRLWWIPSLSQGARLGIA
jgi:hypothetical protein